MSQSVLLMLLACNALPLQQNPPWAQTAAYQSSLRDVRNPTAMTLIGRGDPTGRGRGFAFTREDPKKAKEDAANPQGVKAQADGSITGERTHVWMDRHHLLAYLPAAFLQRPGLGREEERVNG